MEEWMSDRIAVDGQPGTAAGSLMCGVKMMWCTTMWRTSKVNYADQIFNP